MNEAETSLDQILDSYGELLHSVDRWFARASTLHGESISCSKGCSDCCRGLFDITLLDACYLKRGFDLLPLSVREAVTPKAADRLARLRTLWPELRPPFILNVRPEEEWDELMPDDDETPCPLLGESGVCLAYEYRPMTCRLHGIPLIDVSGEVFHDEWCTLNFQNSDPLKREALRWEFRECFERELSIFHILTTELLQREMNELDIFIPTALLLDYRRFDWKGWWLENCDRIRVSGFPERS